MYNAKIGMLSEKRFLCIDWGIKRIGLAISDPSGTIAQPFLVITHTNRKADAHRIQEICLEKQIDEIVIGVTYDETGQLNPTGRSADRLAIEVEKLGGLKMHRFDESFSTNDAQRAVVDMGIKRRKRKGHQDAIAAAIILQKFLDSRKNA